MNDAQRSRTTSGRAAVPRAGAPGPEIVVRAPQNTRSTAVMTTIAKPDAPVDVAKHIYTFEEGSAEMRDLLGGKGANLCEMARMGLPVPPGFVITTETCRQYYALGNGFPD